jgi:hypothetical protein
MAWWRAAGNNQAARRLSDAGDAAGGVAAGV